MKSIILFFLLVILFSIPEHLIAQSAKLNDTAINIIPIIKTPEKSIETVHIKLRYDSTKSGSQDTLLTNLHFELLALKLPNKPKLLTDTIFISAETWKKNKGVIDTTLDVQVSCLQTMYKNDEIGFIKIKEQTNTPVELRLLGSDNFINDTLANTSFVSASFIKSIAGTNIPANELLDIFMRLNFGKKSRAFSLFSVDAGLGNDTSKSLHTNINEAMANINYAFYLNPFSKFNNNNFNLYRTGFMGGGLKIFNNQILGGLHIGVIEIGGPLYGSYVLGGFYHNFYSPSIKYSDSTSSSFNFYQNNIYFEAGLNILSKGNATFSTFFNSIRFKFGLLLPMKSKSDELSPRQSDIITRLCVEIPLGIIRFTSKKN